MTQTTTKCEKHSTTNDPPPDITGARGMDRALFRRRSGAREMNLR